MMTLKQNIAKALYERVKKNNIYTYIYVYVFGPYTYAYTCKNTCIYMNMYIIIKIYKTRKIPTRLLAPTQLK